MDFIWNTSLKNVQVQFSTQKMPKKESKMNQKRNLGREICGSVGPEIFRLGQNTSDSIFLGIKLDLTRIY